MPDVRCSNCNTLLQPRHYEKGKCFNCDNSIKDYEKVLLKNEGKSLKKMLLSISSIVVILFLYGFISIYAKSSSSSISNKIDMCRCLTEPGNSEWSRDNENNCDRSINDYLGFNWKSTNFSLQKNKSKQEKWERLTSQCTSSSSSSSSSSNTSSSNTSCSYSGASSFAKERAGYAFSTINGINRLEMGRVRSMGYDSDYGFLVEGTNHYGTYTILTLLISCSNGKYEVDLAEAS